MHASENMQRTQKAQCVGGRKEKVGQEAELAFPPFFFTLK